MDQQTAEILLSILEHPTYPWHESQEVRWKSCRFLAHVYTPELEQLSWLGVTVDQPKFELWWTAPDVAVFYERRRSRCHQIHLASPYDFPPVQKFMAEEALLTQRSLKLLLALEYWRSRNASLIDNGYKFSYSPAQEIIVLGQWNQSLQCFRGYKLWIRISTQRVFVGCDWSLERIKLTVPCCDLNQQLISVVSRLWNDKSSPSPSILEK